MRYAVGFLLVLVACGAVDDTEQAAPPNRPALCSEPKTLSAALRDCVKNTAPEDSFTRDGCFREVGAMCGWE